MDVVQQTNNWILYSDGEVYVLDSRCNYGIVEPTATFMLLPEEIQRYRTEGVSVINELSEASCTSSGKSYYEKVRPVSEDLLQDIRLCDKRVFG